MSHRAATIRRGVRADVRLLPDIERAAGERFREIPELAWIADDAVMPESALAALIDDKSVWVAEADRGIVGFVAVRKLPGLIHVQQLAVTHDAQGLGFGKRLMVAAHEDARALDLRCATLTTFRDVRWNDGFYTRLGYRLLDEDDLDDRLRAILAEEAAHGLPIARRCAMRLTL